MPICTVTSLSRGITSDVAYVQISVLSAGRLSSSAKSMKLKRRVLAESVTPGTSASRRYLPEGSCLSAGISTALFASNSAAATFSLPLYIMYSPLPSSGVPEALSSENVTRGTLLLFINPGRSQASMAGSLPTVTFDVAFWLSPSGEVTVTLAVK